MTFIDLNNSILYLTTDNELILYPVNRSKSVKNPVPHTISEILDCDHDVIYIYSDNSELEDLVSASCPSDEYNYVASDLLNNSVHGDSILVTKYEDKTISMDEEYLVEVYEHIINNYEEVEDCTEGLTRYL